MNSQTLTYAMLQGVQALLHARAWYGVSDTIPRGTVYVFNKCLPDVCFVCHPADLTEIREGLPEVSLVPIREYLPRERMSAYASTTFCTDCHKQLTILTQMQLTVAVADGVLAIPLCADCHRKHLDEEGNNR